MAPLATHPQLEAPGVVLTPLPVATIARPRGAGALTAYVTLLAGEGSMDPGERKIGAHMAEFTLGPASLFEQMAGRAIPGVSLLEMVGIGRREIVLLVADVAGERSGPWKARLHAAPG